MFGEEHTEDALSLSALDHVPPSTSTNMTIPTLKRHEQAGHPLCSDKKSYLAYASVICWGAGGTWFGFTNGRGRRRQNSNYGVSPEPKGSATPLFCVRTSSILARISL